MRDSEALFSDPVHGYIRFTVRRSSGVPREPAFWGEDHEATEQDLIDSPWVQRLRQIYQLQSARWVFPSAEHSRFQHSLGAMHVAGRFARHLYPGLKAAAPDCPSEPLVTELLRVTALLHDVGHGPFCHFFDDNILEEYGLTHEHLGQRIIVEKLGETIGAIRRSPDGEFEPGERIDPEHVAFLILKDAHKPTGGLPRWLLLLQPLLGGIYTADNLDYVLRDAYMCGVAIGPVDLDRLIYYTMITERGLTLHRAGCTALAMFLTARLYLYSNVYYHRTTRAIDLHMREIFRETVKQIFPHNPAERLDEYLELTDTALLHEVRTWHKGARGRLGEEWRRILARDVKWRMAYDTTITMREPQKGRLMMGQEALEQGIRRRLPEELKDLPFRVDIASQDPRPLNPLMMGGKQIYVYNPSTGQVSAEPLNEFFDFIPARIVQCRIFAHDHRHDGLLSELAEKVLLTEGASIRTNV